MSNLYSKAKNAHTGDNETLLLLIEKFKPLLCKYAHKLPYDYDDAYSDMQLAFIEMIRSGKLIAMNTKVDGCLVNYICKCMYHAFANNFNHFNKVSNFPMSDSTNEWGDQCHCEDKYDFENTNILFSCLTKREAEIVTYYFWGQYSVREIAHKYNVSSASISRSKRNAYNKLKKGL